MLLLAAAPCSTSTMLLSFGSWASVTAQKVSNRATRALWQCLSLVLAQSWLESHWHRTQPSLTRHGIVLLRCLAVSSATCARCSQQPARYGCRAARAACSAAAVLRSASAPHGGMSLRPLRNAWPKPRGSRSCSPSLYCATAALQLPAHTRLNDGGAQALCAAHRFA